MAMFLEQLNRTLFSALNATAAPPVAIEGLKMLAEATVWLLPILVGSLWLIGSRASRETAVMAGLAACVAMLLAHVASMLVDHPRPFMVGLAPNLLDHADDSSFPSDHATLFFALAAVFWRRSVSELPGLGWSVAGLGLVVGLSRVALGVHFPFDIIGALGLGALGAFASEFPLCRAEAVLFHIGEGVRRRIGPLAARDGREFAG